MRPRTANSGDWRSPQVFAGTRTSTWQPARSRQEKTPSELGWGFIIGGGGGNRTRVRKPYTGSSTYLVRYFCALSLITPAEQAEFRRAAFDLAFTFDLAIDPPAVDEQQERVGLPVLKINQRLQATTDLPPASRLETPCWHWPPQ